MTPVEIDRLARCAAALRPDWPLASLRTRMIKFAADNPHRSYGDTAHALVEIALDPKTLTPARLDESGPWWDARPGEHERPRAITSGPEWRPCRWHGGHSSDTCPGPKAETRASRDARVVAVAAMRAALANSRPIDAEARRQIATDADAKPDTP